MSSEGDVFKWLVERDPDGRVEREILRARSYHTARLIGFLAVRNGKKKSRNANTGLVMALLKLAVVTAMAVVDHGSGDFDAVAADRMDDAMRRKLAELLTNELKARSRANQKG